MTSMPNWEGFMIPTLKVMSDGVGVQVKETYKVVEIDEDFFA